MGLSFSLRILPANLVTYSFMGRYDAWIHPCVITKTMKKLIFTALVASTFLLAQSCSTKPKDSTEVAEQANDNKVDSGMTAVQGEDKGEKTDATDFAMKAAEGSMFEIEAAKVALQKGQSKMVKDMAQMIQDDHKKASEELMPIAKAKNISLPVGLSNEKMEEVNKLAALSGKDFDEKYINMMVDDHEADTKMFRKASEDLQDVELREFAAKTLPTLEKHLSMAKEGHKMEADKM